MENSEKSSSPAPSSSASGGKEKIEKQARQLAYDVRYKTKQSMAANKGQKLDPAAVRKAYIAQLSKSTGAPQVKARAKEMLLGENYINVKEFASDTVASIIKDVFTEKLDPVGKEDSDVDNDGKKNTNSDKYIKNKREKISNAVETSDSGDKKFKVRVTDKGTGNTYVRMATRAKIAELRANTNISSVEITGHGEPSSTKAEEFISGELIEKTSEEKEKKITGKGVNNKKLIKVYPDSVTEQATEKDAPPADDKLLASKEKKINMVKKQVLLKKLQAVRAGGGSEITASHEMEGDLVDEVATPQSGTGKYYDEKNPTTQQLAQREKREKIKKLTAQGKHKEASALHNEDAKYGYDKDGKSLKPKDKVAVPKKEEEDDYRGMKTKVDLVRNKMRAMGLKMSHEPEGEELTEEFITERVDYATEYFYKQGINPDGLDIIIEEVGLDDFVEFVLDGPQELNEDEDAYQKAKKKADTGAKRREKEGKGEYSPQTKGSKSPYAKEGLGVKPKKKPKIGHTGTKVVAATKKAKKEQPAKPTSREGLGSKIRSAVKKGVERHKAATKKASGEIKKIAKTASDTAKQHAGHRKKFVSGLKATPKEKKIAGGVAKAVKKSLTREELELEAKVDTVKKLDDEGKEDARNYRKYGTKHSQFFQAVRRRSEHRSERGVKKIKGQKPAPKGAYGES